MADTVEPPTDAPASGDAASPELSSDVFPAAALKAAQAQAASLALLNAVQHLQRTAVLVETATALSLAQALRPAVEGEPGGEAGWSVGLQASQQAMRAAIEAFQDISVAARRLGEA